ncbi:MAG: hypothetical protein [Caudoviricetes sp.]|nr:MAG: hypothetical protein [Caudoviricetes sp.]
MGAIEKRAREPNPNVAVIHEAMQHFPEGSWMRGALDHAAAELSVLHSRCQLAALTPPEKPDPALLVSMAMRINHGFGLMDRMAQNSLLTDMSKVWEEIVGRGYYSPENASRYLRELASADARPEVKNVND